MAFSAWTRMGWSVKLKAPPVEVHHTSPLQKNCFFYVGFAAAKNMEFSFSLDTVGAFGSFLDYDMSRRSL